MHLNILLNRINWRRLTECALCFCVFLVICSTAAYAEDAPVTIETGAMTYSDTGFAVDVTVTFKDMSLYNERVYLSYHVMDENGEYLLFENQRLPFHPDAAFTTVYVEWTSLDEIADRSTAVIQFDLVDEANAYWFLENNDIVFQTASVVFDREMEYPSSQEVLDHDETSPIEEPRTTVFSAVLNIIVWVVLAVLVCLFIKRQSDFKAKNSAQRTENREQRTENREQRTENREQRTENREQRRIDFLIYLRGLACLFIVWSHYVGIFEVGNIQDIFPHMLPRSSESTTFFNNIVLAFGSEGLSFGALGVSIFFLITGFLTAHSLDKNNHASFLAKKFFRIYPLYIVGTAFLYITTLAYTKWAGTDMPYPVKNYIIQASLLRDWCWIPSVDQIGWTLEVQIKMYVIYFLLHKLGVLQNRKKIIFTVGICAFLILGVWPYAGAISNYNEKMYTTLYVVVFSAIFIIFGLFGVIFYQYYCNRWSAQECWVTGGFCVFCFWISAEHFEQGAIVLSYLVGTALFAAVFLLRNRICCGRVISFISNMSFSIYIVHGVNGYYSLSVLDYYGINPYVSLCLTTCAALLVAYSLYRLVEKPCTRVLKK